MTVPAELNQAYYTFLPVLEKLKGKCDQPLGGVAHSVGGRLVPGRIKKKESILQRIEKDGLAKPFQEIDDLLAATIVVPNPTLILQVEERVSQLFEIVESVPPRAKTPQEFVYDDHRVILRLRQEPGREEDPELANIKFELQIKTVMQEAASSLSRELEYKPRRLSWTRARLASSIRALVEMVDRLLARLAKPEDVTESADETYQTFRRRNKIIKVLEQMIAAAQIAEDRRRLAITVEQYLDLCKPKVCVEELEEILKKEEYAKIREAASLSAAGSVFIVLVLEGRLAEGADPAKLRGQRCYLITSEMIDLCPVLKGVPEDRRVHLTP